MRIRFLAADSFGVRSMAHTVETPDVFIGIDMWASFAPKRYGLPPHPLENLALDLSRSLLSEIGREVDVHVITHYHYDHYCPDCDFYRGKRIIGKDWKNFVNRSQRIRFSKFRWRDLVEPADGRTFYFGGTKVEVSPPVYHGEEGTKLGWVVMVYVEENQGFLYTSDVEGLLSEDALEWITSREPDIIYIDGPLSYMAGYRVKMSLMDRAWENILRLAEISEVIVDHHGARDKNFYERIEELGLKTASMYHFSDNLPLEALRKDLWKGMDIPEDLVVTRYKR